MKTVFILFDSLNRQALSCYGGTAIATPNFDRLAEQGIVFDNHYVGSLPCMPARRDLLTGRLNFLHRSWGPVEPYDLCFPSMLDKAGVHTHLISDHYHYWEEGGAGYHNQFSSFEFVRGQERDLYKAMVEPPMQRFRKLYHPMLVDVPRRAPNMVNREFIRDENEFPLVRCVQKARDFLQLNHKSDNWLLQLELFDPHEPFTAPARFRDLLPTDYQGPILDWPLYDRLDLTTAEKAELRANYHAVVAMCDEYLGKILDDFDRLELWKDTTIVLTTDHGFLLGEQDWWGKNRMPMYDPIVHIPLLISHPQLSIHAGTRHGALTQCLDVNATLLNAFGVKPTACGAGSSLTSAVENGKRTRDYALFGIFGGALNITDGVHSYFRYPSADSKSGRLRPLYEYTLMPMHPQSYFSAEELRDAELVREFDFTMGMPLLRIPARDDAKRPPMQGGALADAQNAVYELGTDAGQIAPVHNPVVEQRMVGAMIECLRQNQAPAELFERFALS